MYDYNSDLITLLVKVLRRKLFYTSFHPHLHGELHFLSKFLNQNLSTFSIFFPFGYTKNITSRPDVNFWLWLWLQSRLYCGIKSYISSSNVQATNCTTHFTRSLKSVSGIMVRHGSYGFHHRGDRDYDNEFQVSFFFSKTTTKVHQKHFIESKPLANDQSSCLFSTDVN